MTKKKSEVWKKASSAIALLLVAGIVVWLALPRPPLLNGIAFSQCIRDQNGKILRVTLTPDQKFRIWTPLPDISPEFIDATLQYRR